MSKKLYVSNPPSSATDIAVDTDRWPKAYGSAERWLIGNPGRHP
jgi:hypothetical protein